MYLYTRLQAADTETEIIKDSTGDIRNFSFPMALPCGSLASQSLLTFTGCQSDLSTTLFAGPGLRGETHPRQEGLKQSRAQRTVVSRGPQAGKPVHSVAQNPVTFDPDQTLPDFSF